MSYTEKVQNKSSRGKIGDYLKRIRADEGANQTRTVGMPLVEQDEDEMKIPERVSGFSNPAWMHKKGGPLHKK